MFESKTKAYACCSLPAATNGPRQVLEFYGDELNKLVDPIGNEFRIVSYGNESSILSQAETSRAEYFSSVQNALKSIHRNEFEKVIISRIKHLNRNNNSSEIVFRKLLDLYPHAFVYYLNHPAHGTWMGATPEMLLIKREQKFKSVSLAGTQQKNDSREYIWNEKLLHEQGLVTNAIQENLIALGVENLELNGPDTLIAGPVVHLRTGFSFSSELSAQKIAEVLHPTPAVSGFPRESAIVAIGLLENHKRRLYTGFLGIDYTNGDADYFVNLRCMQVFEHHYELHLGGGITTTSDVDAEWLETEHKAQVLMSAF